MICKMCGKPIFGKGECLYCGNRQIGYATAAALGVVADETLPTSKNETEDLSATLPDYVANNNEQNQVANSENQLALMGVILSICSLFVTMLSIPSFIMSVMALGKANDLNGVGRSKAIVGIVISSIIIALSVIVGLVVIPNLQY